MRFGGQVPSDCLSAPRQLLYTVSVPPDSSSTLSQCLPTAPLHCLPVPPDSSATLSPGRYVTLLLAILLLLYTVSVPPDSSSTLSQCLPTAPLHCLPVPPDSSATLSPGRYVTLLLAILLASARFCRGTGWGVREAGWKHE